MFTSTYARELIHDGCGILDRHTNVHSMAARKFLLVVLSPLLAVRHAQGIRAAHDVVPDAGANAESGCEASAETNACASAETGAETCEQVRSLYAGLQPDGREILDYTEMFITSYCSLRCKWCSASIPYYPNTYHIPTEFLLAQVERYLEIIDGVEKFRVLGGEPFLHPDLDLILQPLIESPKVGSVRIVSNGTIVPHKPSLRAELINPKVVIDRSDYREVSCKLGELRALEAQGKLHLNVDTQAWWFIPNHIYTDKGLNDRETLERYRACPDPCHVLRDGRFYSCGEAFHIAHIPDTPMVEGIDYVNLMDETVSVDKLRRQVNDLVFKRAERMCACNRCVGSYIYKDRSCLVPGAQLQQGESCPFELPADIAAVAQARI